MAVVGPNRSIMLTREYYATVTLVNLIAEDPYGRFPAVTIEFVQSILQPFEHAILHIDDREGLEGWVQQTFPFLSETIHTDLGEAEYERTAGDDRRLTVLDAIFHDLLEETPDLESIILPWDIVATATPALAAALGFDQAGGTIPITVTVGDQQFTHPMTADQALGLILFQRIAGIDFHPSMDGREFGFFEDRQEQNRFDVSDTFITPIFRVEIGGQVYQFLTPAFMQGFVTGALWTNTDHHAYWSHLVMVTTPASPPTPLYF